VSAGGPELLLIGYGNSLRGDDGAGPHVAEAVARLDWPGVEVISCPLLAPELAEPISRSKKVIFVDAAIDAPREVQLRPLAPAESSQVMAHAADPRTVLALARDVYGHSPQAWWLTIPAENLEVGEHLSAFAAQGAGVAIKMIQELSREIPSDRSRRGDDSGRPRHAS
jgi:hydrogenase maturation protease